MRQMEEVLTQTHILATVRDEVGGDKHVKRGGKHPHSLLTARRKVEDEACGKHAHRLADEASTLTAWQDLAASVGGGKHAVTLTPASILPASIW